MGGDRGTTLRVVGFLLAEMCKQPGGSVYDVAMKKSKGHNVEQLSQLFPISSAVRALAPGWNCGRRGEVSDSSNRTLARFG